MGRFKPTFLDEELIKYLTWSPGDSATSLAEHFEVTRQDMHHRLNKLMDKGYVVREPGAGRTPSKYYVTKKRPWGRGFRG